ncbi:hypothetical protein IMPR6_210089 [Imperialibacter sp. EC-SDR9]|nr:hypothetical protein IMPERIA89_350011 [Imperialibacter sp. 89]CAD5288636.1 hypothetical protein IMPERIA75_620012 [Imperialibacter sp. 75]VVT14660.1 hypothetical protein IMPR6_210089 [Imperialibacter sp. EC-SDR9]
MVVPTPSGSLAETPRGCFSKQAYHENDSLLVSLEEDTERVGSNMVVLTPSGSRDGDPKGILFQISLS